MSQTLQKQLFVDGLAASEPELVALGLALGAEDVPGWSTREKRLASAAGPAPSRSRVRELAARIVAGEDPLGESFCRLRPPAARRAQGATYTPLPIVETMLDWVTEAPARVVDPGTGSGRFLLAAARRFTKASLLGIELDPLAALIARANLQTTGAARRSAIVLGDYREWRSGPDPGMTLFVGNPPYVRHHEIDRRWKRWLAAVAARRGVRASGLAGLHAHFYLATAEVARPSDVGCFVTAAEWLDVNYGRLIRELLLNELGLDRLAVLEPTAMPFPDATTTAVITRFRIGTRPSRISMIRVRDSAGLASPNGSSLSIRRERLAAAERWTSLTRRRRRVPSGFVQLGELCRVHRGQVTGNNRFWIAGPHSRGLPECVLHSAITRAQELFESGTVLEQAENLRLVIDLPASYDRFAAGERRAIERFLALGRELGIHEGYIASRRKPWWSVRLREPAPILATYMARRPPAFVYNKARVRHINIAHGIYPRDGLDAETLIRLAAFLSRATRTESGRTYAGGLTKFEPREMERLLVPTPENLLQEPP